MENFSVAKICKIIASVLLGILTLMCVISGLILLSEENFKLFFMMIISYSVVGAITFIPLYALGEIIDTLHSISFGVYKTNKLLVQEEQEAKEEKVIEKDSAAIRIQKESLQPQEGWVCKKCRTRNSSNTITCKDCGAYK